jgi:hypothetical protein
MLIYFFICLLLHSFPEFGYFVKHTFLSINVFAGSVVVGSSSINRSQQNRFITPLPPHHFSPDEDRASLRNVVILIF